MVERGMYPEKHTWGVVLSRVQDGDQVEGVRGRVSKWDTARTRSKGVWPVTRHATRQTSRMVTRTGSPGCREQAGEKVPELVTNSVYRDINSSLLVMTELEVEKRFSEER